LVGTGKLLVKPLLEGLAGEEGGAPQKESFLRKVVTRVASRPVRGLVVKDGNDSLLRLARCCLPIKGEPIIGYMTAGKGVTVHAQRCPYVAKELLDGRRTIEVAWDPGLARTFRARLQIKAADSPGVLAKVAAVITELGGNIVRAEVEAFADGKGQIKIELDIRDIDQLERMSSRIGAFKEVDAVERS
jgi:GTP pyrophosphokinase